MLPSDATLARDTPHAHAHALWHVLTKYPWQDCADEEGEAGDRHQHVLHQHFHHPGAERLHNFLNNMQVEMTVTSFESIEDSDTNAENAGSSSRRQHTTARSTASQQPSHIRSMPALYSSARQRVPVRRGSQCAHRRQWLAISPARAPPLARSVGHLSLSHADSHVCKHDAYI